jgi:hypothetical protein
MEEETRAVVQRMVDAWNAHDLDTTYGLLHEDYRQYNGGRLAFQSRDEARAADQPMYDAMPDYRREVDDLVVSGQSAAMRWRFFGTGSDGPVEMSGVTFFKVEEGQIVECWLYRGQPITEPDA